MERKRGLGQPLQIPFMPVLWDFNDTLTCSSLDKPELSWYRCVQAHGAVAPPSAASKSMGWSWWVAAHCALLGHVPAPQLTETHQVVQTPPCVQVVGYSQIYIMTLTAVSLQQFNFAHGPSLPSLRDLFQLPAQLAIGWEVCIALCLPGRGWRKRYSCVPATRGNPDTWG